MPYQLHCWGRPLGHANEELEERLLDVTTLEDDERTDEAKDDEAKDLADDADDVVPLQIAPVTAGVSTAPLVATCTPKDTVCPGFKLPFQPTLDAL